MEIEETVEPMEVVTMSHAEFNSLREYSLSFPTGKEAGKKWKRFVPGPRIGGEWWQGEYVDYPDSKTIGVNWRKIETLTLIEEEIAQLLATRVRILERLSELGICPENSESEPDRIEQNPHYPEKPEDGKHVFNNGSYRCALCAVYNRPDSPPFHEPCKGEWAESGKMRAWADDKWAAEKAAKDAGL